MQEDNGRRRAKSPRWGAPGAVRLGATLPSISGTCPAAAGAPGNSANTTPSIKRAIIVVLRTVAIFSPSRRAISQDRTSGLMPMGTRILAPHPASRAPVRRKLEIGRSEERRVGEEVRARWSAHQ